MSTRRSVRGWWTRFPWARAARPRRPHYRPRLDDLENRVVPSSTVWTRFYPDNGTAYATAQAKSLAQDTSTNPVSPNIHVGGTLTTLSQQPQTTGLAITLDPFGFPTNDYSGGSGVIVHGTAAGNGTKFLVGENDSGNPKPSAFAEAIPPNGNGQGVIVTLFPGVVGVATAAEFFGGFLYVTGWVINPATGLQNAFLCKLDPVTLTGVCQTFDVVPGKNSCGTGLHVIDGHIDLGGVISNPDHTPAGSFGLCLTDIMFPPPEHFIVNFERFPPDAAINGIKVRVENGHREVFGVGTANVGAPGNTDLYVEKFDFTTQTLVWKHYFADVDGSITGVGIDLDANGNIYVVGGIDVNPQSSSAAFAVVPSLSSSTSGSSELTPPPPPPAVPIRDGYVAKITGDGTTILGLQYLGNSYDPGNTAPTEAQAVLVYTDPNNPNNPNPDIIVSGWTQSSDYDPYLQGQPAGAESAFVTRVCQDPVSGGALPLVNTYTGLVSSVNPSQVNQPVTLTATVTPVVADVTIPSSQPMGTVSFFDVTSGQNLLGVAALNGTPGSDRAVRNYTFTAPGGYQLRAVYNPATISYFSPSAGSLTQLVQGGTSSSALLTPALSLAARTSPSSELTIPEATDLTAGGPFARWAARGEAATVHAQETSELLGRPPQPTETTRQQLLLSEEHEPPGSVLGWVDEQTLAVAWEAFREADLGEPAAWA